MNLGENLKKLRKEYNLSQEQLAEKLNISRQAISKWESGKAYPDIDNLILLRNIFNTTIDELIMVNDKTNYNKLEVDYSDNENSNEEINHFEEKNKKQDGLSEDLIIGGTIIGMIVGIITGNYMWSMAGFIGLGLGFIIEPIGKYLKGSVKK